MKLLDHLPFWNDKGEPFLVNLPKGGYRLQGHKKKETGITYFRGIPFAAPPVGSLRFKKPQPHPGWEGVRDCYEFGKTAVQGNNPVTNNDPKKAHALSKSASEDCLFLNIETPSVSGKYPVMVWIHGGAFQFGASSQTIYHPKASLLAKQGIVLVTINYRLGVFGFLKLEGGDYNNGIWDQVAALQWVQDNIKAFGGDPTNVTIFGESAGGMSCGFLTATKYAGHLFHRAILQSGSGQSGLSKEDAAWLATDVAKVLGLSTCSFEKLKDVPAHVLLAAQNAVIREKRCGAMPFQPCVDGELLEDRVVRRWKDGVAEKLDVMIGYTRDEDLLFLRIFKPMYECRNEGDLVKRIARVFAPDALAVKDGDEAAKQGGDLFERTARVFAPDVLVKNGDEAAKRVVEEVKAWEGGPFPEDVHHEDYWTMKAVLFNSYLKFAIPAHVAAEALMSQCKSIYMYRFDVHSPLLRGACHAIDLPYVFGACNLFGRLCPPDSSANAAVSNAVIQAWTNFAKTGDPNTAHADNVGSTTSSASASASSSISPTNAFPSTASAPASSSSSRAPESTSKNPADNGGTTKSPSTSAPPPSSSISTPTLPTWPALTPQDSSKVMIIDLPLSTSRVQSVKVHEAFPELWKISLEDARALWFHRPPKFGVEEHGVGADLSMKANL